MRISYSRKEMLNFTGSYPLFQPLKTYLKTGILTSAKIGQTYFKIQGTYFKIPALYFFFAQSCVLTFRSAFICICT